jgi:dihydrodipicolinate synthase/N-acetylneuraminate lyase
VDEGGYRRHLRRFLGAAGTNEKVGIIALPEAAEIFYLTRDEKHRILEIAMEEVGGKIPVIAGVSELTTDSAVKEARHIASLGVDGHFVMPPIGALDITQAWDAITYPEVFTDLARSLADAAPELPMVIHPIGGRTPEFGLGLPAPAALDLCRSVPQVVGWKMTYNYNGFRLMVNALRSLEQSVRIYPSSAHFFQEYLAGGYLEGAASGAFNYAFEPMLQHIAAWRSGDVAGATNMWHGGLRQLHEYVYATHSRLHIRYKVAAWLSGVIDNPFMREPLPKPRKAEVETIARLVKGAGMETIEDSAITTITETLVR